MINPVSDWRRGRLSWLSCTRACLLVLAASTQALSGGAQRDSGSENQIRAAMLYNLSKFIQWAPSKVNPAQTFIVCELGADAIQKDLDNLMRSKKVGVMPVVVRHLSSAEDGNNCNILYAGAGQQKNVAKVYAELARNGVLTVSETPNSEGKYQVIGLPLVEEHVQIQINLSAAERSGLTISSKLLHLAVVSH